ncbi:MAG: hypothetical protein JWM33_1217 [Caulobacteraceae bacterium]|nr:hypothetical protein [Caulobacteraceae bacterium]
MRLLERYLLGQMLRPTLLAVAALIGIALLQQSLRSLDIIVEQRQTAGAFLQVIALAMPQLIALVLPIAVFIAGLAALNRLQSEQELVAAYAAGAGRWRVVAPAMALAGVVAVLCLVVNLWVQPTGERRMRAIVETARSDLATALVRPGAFAEPGPGFTIYVRSVDQAGVLHDVFINQVDPKSGQATTYQASEAQIFSEGGRTTLRLRHASQQGLLKGSYFSLSADEQPIDLSSFIQPSGPPTYEASDRYLNELFFPDLSQTWEREHRLGLLAEGHARLAGPLYNLAFMAMALAAVVGGGFSRLGYGRRIVWASVAAALVRIAGFAIQGACDKSAALNILQYLIPLGAMGITLWIALDGRLPRPNARPARLAAAR